MRNRSLSFAAVPGARPEAFAFSPPRRQWRHGSCGPGLHRKLLGSDHHVKVLPLRTRNWAKQKPRPVCAAVLVSGVSLRI